MPQAVGLWGLRASVLANTTPTQQQNDTCRSFCTPHTANDTAHNKKTDDQESRLFHLNLSGYQDSNLGPPAPKAGALTGLRYIP